MELRQLEYLVAVAEEASFTRAAGRLHVSQPGVSAQVRLLERELGTPLLDRSGRAVTLTEAGRAVLPYARDALGAVVGMRLAVDELTGLVRGSVAVGMVVACTSVDLVDLLAGFHDQHPGVSISLSEANSDVLVARLRDGTLDLSWIGLPGGAPEGITVHLVADEPLVAAVAPTHPLATVDHVRLDDLRHQPLISLPRGTGLRAALDAGCSSIGLPPQVAFEATAPALLAQMAAQGLGVAVLPASVAAAAGAGLRALRICDPGLRGRIGLAWRTGGPVTPAARALVQYALGSRHEPAT